MIPVVIANTRSILRAFVLNRELVHVYGESMPRSGHGYLKRIVRLYFGERLRYCEPYQVPRRCCGTDPCSRLGNAEIYFRKNHDFELSESKERPGKYLIQYRSPIPMLQSYYDFTRREPGGGDRDEFARFAQSRITYFIGFYRKWAAAPRENDLVISYEELTEDTETTARKAIQFMQGNARLDERRLTRVLACTGHSVRTPESLRDPRAHYFDAELFARIERRVAESCGTDRIRFHFLR